MIFLRPRKGVKRREVKYIVDYSLIPSDLKSSGVGEKTKKASITC